MSFQFTPEQIESFRRDGFVAIPHFWTPQEVAAMANELERLKKDGLLHNVATDGDGQTASQSKANLQLCPMSPHSRLFRAMPFAPKVAEAISQLIEGDVALRLDQVFLKPGKHGAGTSWHQDNHYFGISEPTNGVALWTAVHDATVQNGTMRVIPGAFQTALPHERDGGSNHHFRCFPDESKEVIIEIEAGGALFFNYGTPHATGANLTDTERAGVALHFQSAKTLDKSGGLMKFPVIAGESATQGEGEYGEKIEWEKEVAERL